MARSSLYPLKKETPGISLTPAGAHERSPVWSPDGKSIAYFCDLSGEYELHVRSRDGKGEAKRFKLQGSGFYYDPVWSPDSQKILFADNSQSYYWIDLKTGTTKKYASELRFGPRDTMSRSAWSPDSKWISYTRNTETALKQVFMYSLDQDKSYPITDGMSEASNPFFDESGKYLYFWIISRLVEEIDRTLHA